MFLSFLIFILILFLYIHISDQYKKGEDLEIYEMDYKNNAEFHKVCSLKQPILFNFAHICPDFFENPITPFLKGQEIKVKDTNDYLNSDVTSVDYVTLSYDSFDQLSKTDTQGHYFTNDNEDIIEEISEICSIYKKVDPFFKPYFVVQTKYDFLSGSTGCKTPLRYHTNERQILVVTSGSLIVKLTPWKTRKFLDVTKDYYNYEFWGKINSEYYNKIKMLDCIVNSGSALYLPPFWWYSLEFTKDTTVSCFTYNSTMNILSNLPGICRYYFQFHNTTKKLMSNIDEPIKMDDNEESEEKNAE